MKTILCYGDSNTYGRIPGTKSGRFPFAKRWTSLLESKLDIHEYRVISVGRPGRALSKYDQDLRLPSGLDDAIRCVKSHTPIDLIVILLGTNDLKEKFNLSEDRIADNLVALVQKIRNTSDMTANTIDFLVLSTPILHDVGDERIKREFGSGFQKSERLHSIEEARCMQNRIPFLDISDVATIGSDGIHFDEAGHASLANMVFSYIRKKN